MNLNKLLKMNKKILKKKKIKFAHKITNFCKKMGFNIKHINGETLMVITPDNKSHFYINIFPRKYDLLWEIQFESEFYNKFNYLEDNDPYRFEKELIKNEMFKLKKQIL